MSESLDRTWITLTHPNPLFHQGVKEFLKFVNGRGVMEDMEDENIDASNCFAKRSIFFNLKYWKHINVQHNLDVMHIEKNVCELLIALMMNTKGKTKDDANARRDLKNLKLKKRLWLKNKDGKLIQSPSRFWLKAEEKKLILQMHKLTKDMEAFKKFVTDELKTGKEKNIRSSEPIGLTTSTQRTNQGATDIGKKCVVHAWNKNVVAHGEVVEVDPKTIAHNVVIGEGNYKILIETVIDTEAPLFRPNSHVQMIAEVCGGYAVWPKQSLTIYE